MSTQAIEVEELRGLLAGFRPEVRNLLAILHRLQEHYNYVPPAAIPAIAAHLKLSPAQVYGVVTFYSELRTTPPPELLVSWCSGPACRLRGGDRVRHILEAVLGIKLGQDSPDGRYGLQVGQCNGTCHLAPMLWINGQPQGPWTAARAVHLARDLKDGSGRKSGRPAGPGQMDER